MTRPFPSAVRSGAPRGGRFPDWERPGKLARHLTQVRRNMSVQPIGTPLHKFPEPALDHEIIPKERYTSRAFAELEWDAVWTRTWLLAGTLADLEQVGDDFTFEIGRESIVVTRSAPDRIDAFYNVCQHRGSQVVLARGCGHARSFVCPYHLWNYDLTGKLRGLPDREDFPQGVPDDTRMPALRVETWGGWVFVNMDPEAESLAEHLGVVADHLAPYDFARNYALAEDYTFEWACNWKVGVDAFNEVYHVQGIHPGSCPSPTTSIARSICWAATAASSSRSACPARAGATTRPSPPAIAIARRSRKRCASCSGISRSIRRRTRTMPRRCARR